MRKSTSKAGMLKFVESNVSVFKVPELLIFETSVFLKSPSEVIKHIKTVFCGRPLVIRSSAVDEDCTQYARAGEYDSVLNVSSDDSDAIHTAIEAVLSS